MTTPEPLDNKVKYTHNLFAIIKLRMLCVSLCSGTESVLNKSHSITSRTVCSLRTTACCLGHRLSRNRDVYDVFFFFFEGITILDLIFLALSSPQDTTPEKRRRFPADT